MGIVHIHSMDMCAVLCQVVFFSYCVVVIIAYAAVEVRMCILDRFVEIAFLAYCGSTSLRLSLYNVSE